VPREAEVLYYHIGEDVKMYYHIGEGGFQEKETEPGTHENEPDGAKFYKQERITSFSAM